MKTKWSYFQTNNQQNLTLEDLKNETINGVLRQKQNYPRWKDENTGRNEKEWEG